MKKIIITLILCITSQLLAHKLELKLYKKPRTLVVLGGLAGGTISLGGLSLTFQSIKNLLRQNKLHKLKVGTCAVGVSSLIGLMSAYKAISTQFDSEPLLIFDEEGFTYKKSMGLFRGRKYVRYLWKDVISHWSTRLVYGNWWYSYDLKHEWHYHIAGHKDVVTINVRELDISRDQLAKVESLRQGNVSALWRS